jgi:tryptophanyl-tRNA synthetase
VKPYEPILQHCAALLVCGLDVNKVVFRQSDVPQTGIVLVFELFFPFQRLTLAHSFKDKADRLEDVNAGLFSYPMLMAAIFYYTMPSLSL